MCYSALVKADFRDYQRFGGQLDIHAFVKMFVDRGRTGDLLASVAKPLRNAFMKPRTEAEEQVRVAAIEAYRQAAMQQESIIADQTERLLAAQAKLATKPTKTAANDARIAQNKIDAARAKLGLAEDRGEMIGWWRFYPGWYAPILLRDPATGERMVVPARFRCRVPGWTREDEKKKEGSYCARKDSLRTVWRKLFGSNHALIVASRFYESVDLHDLQRRELAPGERTVSQEISFTPKPEQEMLLACLWRYVEETPEEPGFYSFALITRDPPPEIAAAGHDRCVIPIRPENVDAWLHPDPGHLGDQYAILEDPIDVYFQHELVDKKGESGAAKSG